MNAIDPLIGDHRAHTEEVTALVGCLRRDVEQHVRHEGATFPRPPSRRRASRELGGTVARATSSAPARPQSNPMPPSDVTARAYAAADRVRGMAGTGR